MNCYKSGGCGVYENRSCDECPASKPEYLNRNERRFLRNALRNPDKEALKKRDKFIDEVKSYDYKRIGFGGFSISIPKSKFKK